ncbi:hypothetical protein TVNIR_2189 [Thioalkalivibrio nitratireducens DSM 14787]|uniref:Uncharacterized protein n=1 Tax=Thioalkalivibrio nitratireducens (strain DSM 14787 / UNIQEM 213 / ALEN2) TaxID=1255043 RepID=L0DXZ4_THIND|nr:hypothetical protein [Thioalkalivibrio nitratireducens]AGA33845.1 hypothetical protein TVNIR_2189 [Thioalkalivibrio nitratireducens DSM 14787]
MKRRRIDEGLVIVGLVLIGIGGYALYQGEIFLSRLTVSEGQSMGGIGALVIGALFVAAGIYFLFQSRR